MNYSDRNLSNTSFSGKDLSGAKFDNSILINANFYESNLRETSFINANLIDANFSNSSLEGGNLVDANLTNVNLNKTNIRGCNFCRASLINANFEYAQTGISWIKIFKLVYEAFGLSVSETITTASGHLWANSADDENLPNRSIGNLFTRVAIGILLTCLFGKFIFADYQNHNFASLATTILITLFCFTYSIHSFRQIVKTLAKYFGTAFSNANFSGAKFNYTLIANTDFTNATITNVNWRNSKSRCDRD